MSVLIFTLAVNTVEAQPDPGRALWKSLLVPGWGHYYIDHEDWTRGQVHLAADVILITTWFGFNTRASNLRDQYFTLANLRAGIDLQGRDRMFRLAVGDFNSLQAYNEYQLRHRNWNRLIEVRPENIWNWDHDSDRREYSKLRETSDRTRQQIPGIVSLLVINRVISGLSAYIRARNIVNMPSVRVDPVSLLGDRGYTASLSFNF